MIDLESANKPQHEIAEYFTNRINTEHQLEQQFHALMEKLVSLVPGELEHAFKASFDDFYDVEKGCEFTLHDFREWLEDLYNNSRIGMPTAIKLDMQEAGIIKLREAWKDLIDLKISKSGSVTAMIPMSEETKVIPKEDWIVHESMLARGSEWLIGPVDEEGKIIAKISLGTIDQVAKLVDAAGLKLVDAKENTKAKLGVSSPVYEFKSPGRKAKK